jgi:aspartate carbamoyltransferase
MQSQRAYLLSQYINTKYLIWKYYRGMSINSLATTKTMKNTLFQKDFISTEKLTTTDMALLFARTDEMKNVVETRGCTDLLKGKIMTALFYEPSSRTFGSFISSMQRLGGGIIPLNGMIHTSVSKGETLEDTIRVFESFSDIIVIRHPEPGAAFQAAAYSSKPVINAGDGVGEHPTQAVLDCYTMHNHFKSFKNVTLTLVGDLSNGRTVHSLIPLLSLYKPSLINLVSPEELRMPEKYVEYARKHKIRIHETEILDEVVSCTDILYVTRVQKERFSDMRMYEQLKHRYIISRETMNNLKKDAILMHPLPRVGEISSDIDGDPRALYLREQVPNGMYVRMALLSLILHK